MWTMTSTGGVTRYSGNDTVSSVAVVIYNSQSFSLSNASSISPATVIGFESVTFVKGSAAKAWSDGQEESAMMP